MVPVVMLSSATTFNVSVLEAVAPLLSMTWNWTGVRPGASGVPEILPELNVSPEGSPPEAIENVYGGEPPVAPTPAP
jgi:hypothetical protein